MSNTNTYRQPWLHSAVYDGLFILGPGAAAIIITMLLPVQYKTTGQMPVAAWLVLVLLVDVAHVYSTLFRTYWNRQQFAQRRTLYIAVPVACYIAGVLLYSLGGLVFWRVLAYLAVFHFVRQQYGFVRLYSRMEAKRHISSRIDTLTIYAATIYPLVYWHCTPGRNFNWFIAGDFITGSAQAIKQAALVAYVGILAVYTVKEIVSIVRAKHVNVPRNMVMITTVLSWYFGIVYFNGDMAFTLLNVVAHGLPYMALVWLLQQRDRSRHTGRLRTGTLPALLFFAGSIVALAWLEEGLWDGFVWREHIQVFALFSRLPMVEHQEVLALLVPLLSLPQSVHYVLDGFIWRRGNSGSAMPAQAAKEAYTQSSI